MPFQTVPMSMVRFKWDNSSLRCVLCINMLNIRSRENRRIVVTRWRPMDLSTLSNARDSEVIRLNEGQEKSVSKFLFNYPLNSADINSYLHSGYAGFHFRHVSRAEQSKNSSSCIMNVSYI